MEHELKTHPEPFAATESGVKRFEYRQDDRNFEVGDVLWLREWDPETGVYSGRWARELVTYVVRGPAFGIPVGYAILSTRGIELGEGARYPKPAFSMRAARA